MPSEYESFPMFNGRPLMPGGRRVQDEMLACRIDLWKAKDILETGFDCYRSRRKAGTYEKCIQSKGKIIKVVAVDLGNYCLVIQVGMVAASKRKMAELGGGI